MPIKINGQTTGSVTLSAPATGSDVSLTLPTLGFGKVLQVVYGSTATAKTNTTNVYTDTNLTATITPSSTSSKILVLVFQGGVYKNSLNSQNAVALRLVRGSTTIQDFAYLAMYTNSAVGNLGSVSASILDSPETTSATTYKTQFKNNNNSDGVEVQNSSAVSSIVLVEIGP